VRRVRCALFGAATLLRCSAAAFERPRRAGEFFASGSLDTCLKIWDVRRRGCVQTFRGHSRGVSKVAFSPDGRWVVSGGHDGAVKARPRPGCANAPWQRR
jgi:katanin p80 WD40 repeat-containing subunit B1